MIPLKNGPLNKSLFTQELELFSRCLIHQPEKIQFSIDYAPNHQPMLYGKIDSEITINVSELLSKANHHHLQMTQQDSDKLLNQASSLLDYGHYTSPGYFTPEYLESQHLESYYQKRALLTDAEFNSLRSYTGSYYRNINKLLKGNFDLLHDQVSNDSDPLQDQSSSELNQDAARDVILTTVLLGSGLNKLPSTFEDHSSFRGESEQSQTKITYRMDLIHEGGGLSDEPAYMSTSYDKEVSEGFKSSSMIVFDALYGKDIAWLSAFPDEQEFLLNPSTVLWEDYAFSNRNIPIFEAKVVAPLIEGKDDASANELQSFHQLYTWAKNEGIDTDSITPHLLNQIQPAPSPLESLKLSDCLDTATCLDLGSEHEIPQTINDPHPIPQPAVIMIEIPIAHSEALI